jgi:transposase
MTILTTIGLDIAKRVFQVHGVDEAGRVVIQKQFGRSEILDWFSKQKPCLVGMEACATSTYWAREIAQLGHEVKLIPPAYVKPYVRRQKNDRADAAAICEAVCRPSMRFVAIKTIDQQEIQVLHRARELLVSQHVQTGNALRAHLAEFGFIFPQGNAGLAKAMETTKEATATTLPAMATKILHILAERIEGLKGEIIRLDRHMREWHRANADSRRLATIPGIGIVTATAIVSAIGNGRHFRSGREFAAWIGLVPNQNSSGGKQRLGRISKKGNRVLRALLVVGSTSLLRRSLDKVPGGLWFTELLKRKCPRLATVALANKLARIAWAVLTKGGIYKATPVAPLQPIAA